MTNLLTFTGSLYGLGGLMAIALGFMEITS